MADTVSSKLQLWDGWQAAPAAGSSLSQFVLPGLGHPDQLHAAESMGPRSARPPDTIEPFSLQWFLDAEHQRHHRYARWLPSALEFSKHSGETILGLGTGLGTDWVQYARQGASVTICGPSADQLALVRRNFELRELPARFVQAVPTSLPLDPASIDVVCLSDLLHQVRDPLALVDEVYRVLKPGGKVLAITPAKYDIEFWRRILLPWRWRLRSRTPSEPNFSSRRLRGLFHRFVEHRVHKRHLRRADVPHVWRLMPTSMLERWIGRMLVLKAFKPLSSAIHVPLAA
jgi:SAM-dependent methyltransferase